MSDIILSLEITALCMGLVFGAIILLWLMMIVLTAVTPEKETAPDDSPEAETQPEVDSAPQAGDKLRAAVLAVAVALAEQEQSTARPLSQPPTAIVSPWQLGMRTSQRTQKGSLGRR
jgi:Na+-transporting methylmalonyl-CoA/oxaloacetate decarboxylase gamma subunit